MATVTMFEGVELVTFTREDAVKMYYDDIGVTFDNAHQAILASTSGFFNASVEASQKMCQMLDITLTGETFIGVYQPLMDTVSHEDVQAFLYHELGHARLGHVAKGRAQTLVENNVILVDDFELEADAYSAAIVGKDVMRNAIISLTTSMMDVIGIPAGEERDAIVNQVLNSEHMVKRLTALI